MRWLAECSAAALSEALQAVAPELSRYPLTVRSPGGEDPQWHKSSADIAGQFVVKFAWSQPAAMRLAREIAVLTALSRNAAVPCLPRVVVASTDPVLLVTKRAPGAPLFQVVDQLGPEQAGSQLAAFLAALHHPRTRALVEGAVGELTDAHLPPTPTPDILSDGIARWVRPEQRGVIRRWCEWAAATLHAPGVAVCVHGDLHGDNQIWDQGRLQAVVDFETVGIAEPEYDLRALFGPGLGPGVDLLASILGYYQTITGRWLDMERVLAWHLRTTLGDALWRSKAGIPLPDHRTPPEWVDELAACFDSYNVG